MPDDQAKSEDQLLEQWNFLDAMLTQQASKLAGDQERDDVAEVAPISDAGATPVEIGVLRQQVADLNAECQTLMAEVHIRTLRVMKIMREHADELAELGQQLATQKQLLSSLRDRHRETVAKLREARTPARDPRPQPTKS